MIDVNLMHEKRAQILAQQAQADEERTNMLISELERCGQWIVAAIDHGVESTHTLNDIAAGVIEGRFQFWPAEDAAIVTEILQYPQCRHIHGFLAGGNMETIVAMIPRIEQFGRQNGCSAATINGRPGWERVLDDQGYKKALTTVAKVFDTLGESG